MSSEYCDICLNNGRPVKFISSRIQVCQWCVSLLQDSPLNPEEIEKHLFSILRQVRKPPQEPDKNEIWKKAHLNVTGKEFFLETIVTSLFTREKRNKKVQEQFDVLLQQAYASYSDALLQYEVEIKENYRKLISGEYMPMELTSFFVKRDFFFIQITRI